MVIKVTDIYSQYPHHLPRRHRQDQKDMEAMILVQTLGHLKVKEETCTIM